MIIHLARAEARLPQVEAMMQAVPLACHVVSAVDGQQMSEAHADAYRRKLMRPTYPFTMRPSEIAAFHSHRACWQKILDDDLEAALVLEDDLHLQEDVFPRALDLALANIQPGDFIRFPIKLREERTEEIATSDEIGLHVHDRIALGMVAQLVTRDAARALLAASERFDRPVDNFLQMQWVHNVRVATVWPSGVREISAELGGSMIGRKEGLLQKLRREILRPLYRHRIRALARQHSHASK
ncbi:glycosyltransferase family 25 protein [Roseovarius atlanticus]|uniref:glycosyltransferase family 25 protein n=1 Tax=Roseovarius atlanticus TaxID=1641875 RepID=UPI001C960D5F|nr:glycosyltransferase family 25 protein [Roseovarius atlanticus]MBY5988561.1 glycosyltransferase family 25 protein [Roseovarius atlanticus]MBY6123952.1 glycosyltransferase family 25 protein [Roseovarius atlanticus]MBY6148447.1 glycosyltransferase family 25 protein [Roseovarius atlanticus]